MNRSAIEQCENVLGLSKIKFENVERNEAQYNFVEFLDTIAGLCL